MAKVTEKLELLRELREHPDRYLQIGNEFFSVNIVVGVEDNTYVEGGRMFPFPYLNEFNMRKGRPVK